MGCIRITKKTTRIFVSATNPTRVLEKELGNVMFKESMYTMSLFRGVEGAVEIPHTDASSTC